MTSMENYIDSEDSISPFSPYDGSICSQGIQRFLQVIMDLKYATVQKQHLEFTDAGMKYFRENSQNMKHLLNKYNITPKDYGELANFFPIDSIYRTFGNQLPFNLQNSEVLQTATQIEQENGQLVADYNFVQFKDKAT